MKTQFRHQASEFDCVPTTFLNAITYLFERNEIPPLVVQKIYLYSLDTVSSKNSHGHGTTRLAVQMLGNWLTNFEEKNFSVSSEYLSGEDVNFKPNNRISKTVNAGGVALVRVRVIDYWHYILAIKSDTEWLYCFDPYPHTDRYNNDNVIFFKSNNLHSPNLKINKKWLDVKSNKQKYVLGKHTERECLLLKRN